MPRSHPFPKKPPKLYPSNRLLLLISNICIFLLVLTSLSQLGLSFSVFFLLQILSLRYDNQIITGKFPDQSEHRLPSQNRCLAKNRIKLCCACTQLISASRIYLSLKCFLNILCISVNISFRRSFFSNLLEVNSPYYKLPI